MKRLAILSCVFLLVLALTSLGFAENEFDEIRKKHEAWLDRIAAAESYREPGRLTGSTENISQKKPVMGDADKDGDVDQADLDILISTWNLQKGDDGYDKRADFNNDDKVDILDLSNLAANWGFGVGSALSEMDLSALQESTPEVDPVVGDADGDGDVDQNDLDILTGTWNLADDNYGYDARADFNGDGRVDILDLSLLAANWQTGVAEVNSEQNVQNEVDTKNAVNAEIYEQASDPLFTGEMADQKEEPMPLKK